MKQVKQLLVLLTLFVLFVANLSARILPSEQISDNCDVPDIVDGRPVIKVRVPAGEEFSPSRTICNAFFADELIIYGGQSQIGAATAQTENQELVSRFAFGARIANLVATSATLRQALFSGSVREIIPHFAVEGPRAYGYSQDDLASFDKRELENFYTLLMSAATEKKLEELAAALAYEGIKSELSPVIRTSNNEPQNKLYPRQWHWPMVNASEAWSVSKGSNEVLAIVTDTGADFTHEAFANAAIFAHVDATKRPAQDLPLRSKSDLYGHGTAVASIMVSPHEAGPSQVAGGAPGARIAMIKSLDDNGFGTINDVNQSFLVAASLCRRFKEQNPSRRCVMNASFSTFGTFPSLDEAVKTAQDAGVVVIASAGNFGLDLKRFPISPAVIQGVIAVGATDEKGLPAVFSDYGERLDASAPGLNILTATTHSGGLMSNQSGYITASGTSFAAPIVAANVLQMVTIHPGVTLQQIKWRLLGGITTIRTLEGFIRSSGFVNFGKTIVFDSVTPSPIIDLRTSCLHHSLACIAWTTPYDRRDDGQGGTIAVFNLYLAQRSFESTNEPGVRKKELVMIKAGGEEVNYELFEELAPDTESFAAVESVDLAGNVAPLSAVMQFKTKRAEEFLLHTFDEGADGYEVKDGPTGQIIASVIGKNIKPWQLSKTISPNNGGVWYGGNEEKFDYNLGQRFDVLLETPPFEITPDQGLSLQLDSFRDITPSTLFSPLVDLFAVYVETLDEPAQTETIRLAKKFEPEENTQTFSLRAEAMDLTRLTRGLKTFKLVFRIRTDGYVDIGKGWIFDNLRLHRDAPDE